MQPKIISSATQTFQPEWAVYAFPSGSINIQSYVRFKLCYVLIGLLIHVELQLTHVSKRKAAPQAGGNDQPQNPVCQNKDT